ncbi:MAG: C25 family cysteine peptidase [Candidatus Electrothrix sp. YB6]
MLSIYLHIAPHIAGSLSRIIRIRFTAAVFLLFTVLFTLFVQAAPVRAAANDIQGRVMEDGNADASLDDAVDTPLGGVHVYLFRDTTGDGIPNTGDDKVASTVTNSNGEYSFSGQPDGTYWVVVESADFARSGGTMEQTYGGIGALTDPDGKELTPAEPRTTAGPAFGGRRMEVPDGFSSDDPNNLEPAEHVIQVVLDSVTTHTAVDFGFGFVKGLAAGYSEFYIPTQVTGTGTEPVVDTFGEVDGGIWNILRDLDPDPAITCGMHYIISVTASTDSTTIYYDHWEDGYNFDPLNPSTADETVVRNSGEVAVFESGSIPENRGTDVYYDGRDRIFVAGGPAVVTLAIYPECVDGPPGSGSVYNAAWEILPVKPLQTKYTVPVGEGMTGNGAIDFQQTFLTIQSAADNNTITVNDPVHGVLTKTLQQGEVFDVRHTSPGTVVTGTEPLQVHALAGFQWPTAASEADGITIFPETLMDNEYYNPMGSYGDSSGDGGSNSEYATELYINNPNDSPITIQWEDASGTGTAKIPAGETRSYSEISGHFVPVDSASYLKSVGGEKFWAIGQSGVSTADVTGDTAIGDNTHTFFDGGFSLVPEYLLRSDYYLSWAPGDADPVPGTNASAAYVTAVNDGTEIFVDFDGDGEPDPFDIDGTIVTSYVLNRLESIAIRNPDSPFSLTGAHIWSNGPTSLVWAPYAKTASYVSPSLDCDYTGSPLPLDWMDAVLSVIKTTDSTALRPEANQIANFSLSIPAYKAVDNVVVRDTLPLGWNYEAGSSTATVTNSSGTFTSTADPGRSGDGLTTREVLTWDLDSLIAAGANDLDPTDYIFITFTARTNANVKPGYNQNDVEVTGTRDPGGETQTFTTTDKKAVYVTPLTIDKDTSTPVVVMNGEATYTIALENTDPDNDLTAVRATDLLPAGFTYISSSYSVIDNDPAGDGSGIGDTIPGDAAAPTTEPASGATDLTWGDWTLGNGDKLIITFIVNVGNVPGTYDNTASADATRGPDTFTVTDIGTSGNDQGTPEGEDPEEDEDVTIEPDINMDKISEVEAGVLASPGEIITYTVNIENPTGGPLNNIVVTDAVPPGTTYVPGTVTIVEGHKLDPPTVIAEEDFAVAGLSGGTGWIGDWKVLGGEADFDGGDVQINNGRLLIQDNENGGEGAYREVDITGYDSVELNFDYIGRNLVDPGDDQYVIIDISTDGTTWTELARVDESGVGSMQLDITGFIDTDTQIRFLTSSSNANRAGSFFDNIEIIGTKTDFINVPGHDPADLVIAADGYDLAANDGVDGSGPDFMQITYQVRVDDPLAAGIISIDNTAGVTSDEFMGVYKEDSESTPVFIQPEKLLVTTSEPSTGEVDGSERVTIGEMVRYRIAARIPEGSFPNFQLKDNIPSGLQFLDDGTARFSFVSNGGGITSSTLTCINDSGDAYDLISLPSAAVDCVFPAPPAGAISGGPFGSDVDVTFSLGDLTNSDSDEDAEYMVVEFNALVLNVNESPEINQGVDNTTGASIANFRPNTATLYVDDVQEGDPSDIVTVDIAEPAITDLAKTVSPGPYLPGSTVTYTLTFSNTATGNNATTAFDLVLTDTLDANLTPGTVTWLSTTQTDPCAGGTAFNHSESATGQNVTVNVSCLDPGNRVTITIEATIKDGTPGGTISNTGDVTYTSLPGEQGNCGAAPFVCSADIDERDGDDGAGSDDTVLDNYADSDTVPLDVEESADLSLVKVVNDTTPAVGDTVTFTLQVTNNGPNTATNVAVTDVLPGGYTYVSGSMSGGDGQDQSGDPTLVWTVNSLSAAAGSNTVTLTFDAVVNAPTGTADEYLNSAQITASDQYDPDSDPDSDENTDDLGDGLPDDDEDTAAVMPESADLSLVKVVNDTTPAVGDTVTFSLTLTNDGPDTATNVAVTDVLPGGYTYVSGSMSGGDGQDQSGDPTLVWTVNSLSAAAGSNTVTLTFDAVVNAPTGTADEYLNSAQITASDQYDPDSDPDSDENTDDLGDGLPDDDEDTAAVMPESADLSLVKVVNDTTPAVGDTVTFSLTLTNDGPDTATNVAVTDVLPGGYTYVSGSMSGGDGQDQSGDPTLVWTVNSLSAAAGSNTVTLTFDAVVNAPTGTADEYLNSAQITASDQYDPDSDPDSDENTDDLGDGLPDDDEDTAAVMPESADLSLVKVVNDTTPAVGDTVTFSLTLTNDGPDTATNVAVTDVLPGGYTYVSGSMSGGDGQDQSGDPTLVWTVNSLSAAAGSNTVTLTFDAVVNAPTGTADEYLNSAQITASDQYDPDSDPDSDENTDDLGDGLPDDDEDTAAVMPESADLSLVKVVNDTTPAVGDTVTFSLTLTNDGPDTATNVAVTDVLPGGYTYVSGSMSGGDGQDQSGDPTLVWTVNSLSAAAGSNTVTLTFDAVVNAPTGTADEYLNSAQITASDQYDPDSDPDSDENTDDLGDGLPDDDEDTAAVMPESADLSLVKVVNDTTPAVGDTVTFTLQVTNNGPNTATNVAVTDVLPGGYTYVSGSMSGGDGQDQSGDPTLVWTVNSLSAAAGSNTVTLTFDAVVNAPTGTADEYLNSAQITASDQYDPDSDPDSDENTDDLGDGLPDDDEDTAAVMPESADLSLVKVVNDTTPAVGDTVTFSLTLTNDGPDTATNVAVTDVLPGGYTYVSGSMSGGDGQDQSGDPTLVWTVNSLSAAAGSNTVTLTFDAVVNAPTGTADEYLNSAQITASDQYDPDSDPDSDENTDDLGDGLPDDDEDTAAVMPESADLSLVKVVNDTTPAVGDTVTFSLTLTNDGPDTATNVAVTDVLPGGYTYVSGSMSGGDGQDQSGDPTLVWTVNSLSAAAGSNTVTLTFDAVVNAPTGTADEYLNSAQITASDQYDPDSDPDSDENTDDLGDGLPDDDEDTAAVMPESADLSLVKVVNDTTPAVGDTVTFSLTLTNDGPDTATNVAVTDVLPGGYTYVSGSMSGGDGQDQSGDPTLVWTVNSLSAAAGSNTVTLTFDAVVNAPTGTADEYLNSAQITASDQYDPDSDPDSDENTDDLGDGLPDDDEDTAAVMPESADLSLVKVVNDTTPAVGDTVTFSLTLTNDGPDTATNVAVTDVLPGGYTYVSGSMSGGDGQDQSGDPTLVWTVNSLSAAAGSNTVTLTFDAVVNAPTGTADEYLNSAQITASDQYDPDSDPDSDENTDDLGDGLPDDDEDTAAVMPESADLSLVKVVNDTTPAVGDTVTFSLTLTNDGPDTATNVAVTDVLPGGYTYVSGSMSGGDGQDQSGDPTLVWTVNSLSAAAGSNTVTLTFDAVVNAPTGTADEYLNSAQITASDQYDPDSDPDSDENTDDLGDGLPDDDEDTAAVMPESADLSLVKVVNDTTPAVGDTVTFSLTLTNDGPDTATNVAVTDVLPGGYTYVSGSMSGGDGQDQSGDPTLVWTVNSLSAAAGSNTVTLTFDAVVNAPTGTADEYLNSAQITASDQYDPDSDPDSDENTDDLGDGLPDDDEDNVCVTLASLQLIKQVDLTTDTAPEDASKDDIITYTFRVRNTGAETLTDVTVSDPLLTGLSCDPILSLAPGTTVDFNCTGGNTYTITQLDVDNGYIDNTATATGTPPCGPDVTSSVVARVNIGTTPTYAVVSSFSAYLNDKNQVVLEWKTSSETGTVGFMLERQNERTGRYQPVTKKILPGMLTPPHGGIYRLVDTRAKAGKQYTYRVVEVAANDQGTVSGPYTVQADEPLPKNSRMFSGGAGGYTLTHHKFSGRQFRRFTARSKVLRKFAAKRKNRAGTVLKIPVSRNGLVYLSAAELAAASDLPEKRVIRQVKSGRCRLTLAGKAVPLLRANTGSDLWFYGRAPERSDIGQNIYLLDFGKKGKKMKSTRGRAKKEVSAEQSYPARVRAEENLHPFHLYINTPVHDFWAWELLFAHDAADDPAGSTAVHPVAAPYLTGEGDAAVTVNLVGMTGRGPAGVPLYKVTVFLNGTDIGTAEWSEKGDYQFRADIPAALLREEGNEVQVVSQLNSGVTYSLIYLDSIELEYLRSYEAVDGELTFSDAGYDSVTVRGFSSSKVLALDVTTPDAPRRVRTLPGKNQAGEYTVTLLTEPGHTYFVTENLSPVFAGELSADTPSRLRRRYNRADYLIIAPLHLMESAQRLADHRASEGLKVMLVDIEDVQDEFSHSLAAPEAVHDFLSYVYTNWIQVPPHVALVGAGSYDYKNYLGYGYPLVPAKLAATPDGFFPSDNVLADVVGNDGVPEFAIGRIPAVDSTELDRYTEKLIHFEQDQAERDTGTVMTLVTDMPDPSAGDFAAGADRVAELVSAQGVAVNRLAADALGVNGTHDGIINALQQGGGILHYIGHSSMVALGRSSALLTADEVDAMPDIGVPMLMVSMTCSAGAFGYPPMDSIGETAVLRADGAAVGFFGASGLSENHLADIMAKGFYRSLFDPENVNPRIGDAVVGAKQYYSAQGGERSVLDIYNLLGDPALHGPVAVPDNKPTDKIRTD